MFCKNCGTQLGEGASFCAKCGAKIETEDYGGDSGENIGHVDSHNEKVSIFSMHKKKIGISVVVIIALVMALLVYFIVAPSKEEREFALYSSKYIELVKNAHPNGYPNKTYGEAFDSFFASPNWSYEGEGRIDGKGAGIYGVSFTGDFRLSGEKATIDIFFAVSKDGKQVAINTCAINGNELSEQDTETLIGWTFDNDGFELADSSSNSSSSSDTGNNNGFAVASLLDMSFVQIYDLLPKEFEGEVTFEEISKVDGEMLTIHLWTEVDGVPAIDFITYNTDKDNDERYVGDIVILNPQIGIPLNDDLKSDATIADIERLAATTDLQIDIDKPEDDFMTYAYISYGMYEYAIRFTYTYNSYAMEVELFTGRF